MHRTASAIQHSMQSTHSTAQHCLAQHEALLCARSSYKIQAVTDCTHMVPLDLRPVAYAHVQEGPVQSSMLSCCKLDCYMQNADAAVPGCADLFTGNAGQIAVGVILVLLLPCAFLLGSGIFIWRYLYHPRAPQRRAAFILMQDPDEPMVCLCNSSMFFL